MQLRTRIPGPPLSTFVEKLWSFEGYCPAHALERLLPDGSAELVINLRDDRNRIYDRRDHTRVNRYSGCILSGPHSEYFIIDTEEQCATVGVHFRPGGAFPFFGAPSDELHDSHIDLDDLWGRWAAELRVRLLEVETVPARLEILEQALMARATRPLVLHPAVEYALDEFHRGPQMRTIAQVTERIGLSPRRFIEVFREQVGMTPKLFCRVQRFQQVVRTISAGGSVEWSDVALACGYFDQAHFIHDFRAFSGLSPAAYQRLPVRHPNHVPLVD